jgi:hypothetical protein
MRALLFTLLLALCLCLLLVWVAPGAAFTLTIGWANTGLAGGRVETSSPAATPTSATGIYDPMPGVQTLAAGDTVVADACGGMKRITAAGAVATSTVSTFTPPAASNAACRMNVCNVGANTITLDNNAQFKSIGGADIVLTADDCTSVESDGVVWRSTGSLVAN